MNQVNRHSRITDEANRMMRIFYMSFNSLDSIEAKKRKFSLYFSIIIWVMLITSRQILYYQSGRNRAS